MHIGFDAKRAFHNGTGLGNYSRTLIQSLHDYFPQHEYYMFNPKASSRYQLKGEHLHEIRPDSFIHQRLSAVWRGKWMVKDLRKHKIDLFHGLSHEIPMGIQDSGIKSIVTIHDLIFKKYPGQYNPIDVLIYDYKFRYACRHADHIIAISEQTKKDIIDLYKIPEEKISICYQSCDEKYIARCPTEELQKVREELNLPERYFLYVGSVIERKGLMQICKAMKAIEHEIDIPLIVIGSGRGYLDKVKQYIKENNLSHRVIFLSETCNTIESFRNGSCFPAIYQMAAALIYPSVYEGFGIPVLEALWSETPVITSNTSCLPEAGGPGSLYVDPDDPDAIAHCMRRIIYEPTLVGEMKTVGKLHAHRFQIRSCAESVMDVYQKLIST